MKQMIESPKPLAWMLASLTAAYAVVFRLLPYETTTWMLWPFTALTLYAGARLRWWQAMLLALGVQAGTDAIFYAVNQWPASPGTYVSFALCILLGRALLRQSHSPVRVFTGATLGYAVFFLITNTAAWMETSLPEYREKSFGTLMLSFEKGLEFLRARPMHAFGQYVMVAAVFGAHAVLAKRWFPAEVVQPETVR